MRTKASSSGVEGVGHQPVVGIDGEVAAACLFGSVASPFDMGEAEPVGFVGPGLELGLDGEGDLESERGQGVDEHDPSRWGQIG